MGDTAMLTRRIERIDVRRIDEDALALLKSKTNQETGRAELKMYEMAESLRCCAATANRIARRLEAAGLIKRHHTRGYRRVEIEVLQDDNGCTS